MKTTTLSKLLIAFGFLFSIQTFAQEKKNNDSDRLDIKKLEDQYWAAKDDDFTVVQNRTYSKANRLFLNINYGTVINDPFSTGRTMGGTLGYFFNERHGLEVEYLSGSLKDNDTTSYFFNRFAAIPDHNKFKSHMMVNYSYMPFYAKMSFLEKKILYFDMGVTLGLGNLSYEMQGRTQTQNKSTMTYAVGVTQQLFINRYFALRLDFKNTFSKQSRMNWNNGSSIADKNVNDTFITVGGTLFFGK